MRNCRSVGSRKRALKPTLLMVVVKYRKKMMKLDQKARVLESKLNYYDSDGKFYP